MLGDQVAGLIDFYFACTDIRAYDLAVTHSAWALETDGTPADPAVGRALIAGYECVLPLTDPERAELPVLARGACIRFALTHAREPLNTPPDTRVPRTEQPAYVTGMDWTYLGGACGG